MVKPANSLKIQIKLDTVAEELSEKLKQIPNIKGYAHNQELIKYLAQLVEYEIDTSKYPTVNKNDLILTIYEKVFGKCDDDVDKSSLEEKILFIIENELIKKSSFFGKLSYKVLDKYFKKDKKKA